MTATLKAPATELTLKIPSTLSTDARASLEAVLKPIFAEAEPLCAKARTIVVTDVEDKKGMKLAGDTRKAIKAIRVAGEKKRKELKEDALRTGQAIDAIFRPFDLALTTHEEYLAQQENFAERIEAERMARVKAERDAKLASLGVDPAGYVTAAMTDQAFADCVAGIEAQKKAAAEAAAKAEAERIAKEKADAEAREAQRIENERLRAEAAEREKALQAERAQAAAAAEQARKEREAVEAKARAEREAAERVATEERRKREAAERELREKQAEADRQAKAEAAAAKKAARAPDKTKVLDVAERLRTLQLPEVKSEEASALLGQVNMRISQLASWIEQQADQL